jgi:hypothetical protein
MLIFTAIKWGGLKIADSCLAALKGPNNESNFSKNL